jgi:hypothetical protein
MGEDGDSPYWLVIFSENGFRESDELIYNKSLMEPKSTV